MRSNFRKIVSRIALWFGVIAVVFGGAMLFRGKHYAWISLCVSVLVLVPVFRSFEKRDTSSKELVILCVMIAISAAGRFIFAWLPGFKPVTGNHRDHGDVARKGRGICGRRAVRGGLEFLFRTGTVDSVSDARMGADRLFRRACLRDR